MVGESSSSPSWLQPHVRMFGASRSTFHVCGVTGLLLGTSLALYLAGRSSLSPLIVLGLLAIGMVTFLALAMATKIVTGREALVYYHHEVAILTVCALLLRTFGVPLLPYLDVTALGLGVFLACGRCGCLMVGCCHGRPFRWGIRYGAAHATAGFPDCYVGARLFPVQALESFLVATIVLASAALIVTGAAPGSALSWYVVSYSAARIWLEEVRGDSTRPYWHGLSEAQWTSLLLIAFVVIGEWQGRLPASWWHGAILAGSALSLAALAACRTERGALLHPRHAHEIAAIVTAPPGSRSQVVVRRTSLTVGLSRQALGRIGDRDACLYSLSRVERQLTVAEARALARLILNLGWRGRREEQIVPGRHGVFHVVVRER